MTRHDQRLIWTPTSARARPQVNSQNSGLLFQALNEQFTIGAATLPRFRVFEWYDIVSFVATDAAIGKPNATSMRRRGKGSSREIVLRSVDVGAAGFSMTANLVWCNGLLVVVLETRRSAIVL